MKSMIRAFSWNQTEGSHRLMTLIVLSLGLYSLFWGEKISAGNGLGFDGSQYASMTREIGSLIITGQLGSYYAQRILPSAIVHGMLRLSGVADDNENIIRCFELYNLLLVVGACRIWKRCADKLSLSVAGRWIGFSGVFLNFQCSKQTFFYPVLTDVTALFAGMLLLMFYLERKPIGLLVTTVLGAFAWPGRMLRKCGGALRIISSRPRSRWLKAVERAVPAGKVVHAIVDNYAAHKQPNVLKWIADHPRWTFHFTPTSASWLNAVEGFFSAITRRQIRRGAFHSVDDLQNAIKRYIDAHNSDCRPFTWTTSAKTIFEKLAQIPASSV